MHNSFSCKVQSIYPPLSKKTKTKTCTNFMYLNKFAHVHVHKLSTLK